MVFISMNTLCVACFLGNRWDDSHQTRNENGSSVTNDHAIILISLNNLCVACLLGNRWDDSHQTRNENGSSVTNGHDMIFISMDTLCVPCLLGNDHQTLLSSSAFGVRRSPKYQTGLKDASYFIYLLFYLFLFLQFLADT